MIREPKARPVLGLIFILLLSGHEAARIEETVRTQTKQATMRQIARSSALERQEQRKHGVSAESLLQEVNALNLRTQSGQVEVARGRVKYHKHSRSPGCWLGCYKDAFAVARADPAQRGHVTLDIYYELEEVGFEAGKDVNATADHRIVLGPDSHVAVKQDVDGMPGLEVRGLLDGKYSTKKLALYEDNLSIKVKKALEDENDWIPYKGKEMELASVWMAILKTAQALRTSVSEGTSLVQCSYVPSEDQCSVPDFCTLEKNPDEEPKCHPLVGAEQNAAAWERLSARMSQVSEKLREDNCVVNCKDEWQKSSAELSFVRTLQEKTRPMANMTSLAPGMRALAKHISETATALQEKVVGDLSATFDQARQETLSATRLVLKTKGCSNLPEGAIESLFKMSLHIGEQSEESQAARRSEFQSYAEECPWLYELAGMSPEDSTQAIAKEEESSALAKEKVGNQTLPERITSDQAESLEASTSEGSRESGSLLELGQAASMDPITIAAIVVAGVLVLGLLLILLGGLLCQLGVWATSKKAVTDQDMCKKQYKVDMCYSVINKIGCIMVITGLIVLIIIGICLMIAAASQGGGGGGGGGGHYHGGGGVHHHHYYGGGPGFYWWYVAPVYIHDGRRRHGRRRRDYVDAYYGGRTLSSEEIANFDYSRCLSGASNPVAFSAPTVRTTFAPAYDSGYDYSGLPAARTTMAPVAPVAPVVPAVAQTFDNGV
eukprot:CAMPEP_0181442946 /NCGR_PEP_ID=MMETSP1110-20121109/24295_1 /TAXON_ID=174948 /ORGANISM="Symbiodinium sp., Strain CCMP421" /LENGTH=720 /DNA_ID=CAMNT_0023566897 /DNA_START=110 /DNA_END=2272 /DNA_ORIENTATION=-